MSHDQNNKDGRQSFPIKVLSPYLDPELYMVVKLQAVYSREGFPPSPPPPRDHFRCVKWELLSVRIKIRFLKNM